MALLAAGFVWLYVGEPERAISYLQLYRRISPLDPRLYLGMAYSYLMLGVPDQALNWARRAVSRGALWVYALAPLAGALAQLGRSGEAKAVAVRLIENNPRYRVGLEVRKFKPSPARDLLKEGLLKAGFPE